MGEDQVAEDFPGLISLGFQAALGVETLVALHPATCPMPRLNSKYACSLKRNWEKTPYKSRYDVRYRSTVSGG
jgi:hypothetical protein